MSSSQNDQLAIDISHLGQRVMRGLRPDLALEGLQELVFIGTGELYLRLSAVDLGHFVLDEEVVDAELLAFGKGVDAGEYAAVFIEVSGLELANLAFDQAGEHLLHLFAELFRLALAALRGVQTAHPKVESSGCSVEIKDGLDGVSICHLAHLRKEGLVIQRKLRRVLCLYQPIILLCGHWLQL